MDIESIRGVSPEFSESVAKGVAALCDGEREKARRALVRALRADPRNATAWYWLSRAVDDAAQRKECLARVRRLDRARSVARFSRAEEGRCPSRERQRDKVGLSGRGAWRRYALVAALLVLLACAAVPLMRPYAAGSNGTPLRASGVIEAHGVSVASAQGGTIAALFVREGEAVRAGQVIARLDTSLLDAQIAAAREAVALAEARLAQARAGARPGQVAIAEAQLAQAQAARDAAAQAVDDALALLEDPQEIRMQIAVLEAQVAAERQRLARQLALKDAAEIGKDQFKDAQAKIMEAGGPGKHRVPIPGVPGGYYEYTVPSLPLDAHLAPNRWWQAWVGVNATAAQVEGMEAALAQLRAQRDNPQALEARADEAIAALAQAEARVLLVRAQVDGLKAGATPEELTALEARVDQARAALEALRSQRGDMEVAAPIKGTVTSLPVRPGEVVAPGATIATVADLHNVRLTIYVPGPQLGRVALGQAAQVRVDSHPGRVFEGRVTHIADTAEFVPRNVTTVEERASLVYAVEVSLDNPDGALKPGMPADATLGGR